VKFAWVSLLRVNENLTCLFGAKYFCRVPDSLIACKSVYISKKPTKSAISTGLLNFARRSL
jgi:hypothetical protein